MQDFDYAGTQITITINKHLMSMYSQNIPKITNSKDLFLNKGT